MDSLDIKAQNIKCGGCASNIKNQLGELDGIDVVEVTIENGLVHIEGTQLDETLINKTLEQCGYPPSSN